MLRWIEATPGILNRMQFNTEDLSLGKPLEAEEKEKSYSGSG